MKLPFDDLRRVRLYLVRHGEAAASSGGDDVYGHAISLTPTGVREAQAARDFVRGVPFGAAYCSTIDRAKETMSIILEGQDLPVSYSDALREIEGDFASALRNDLPPRERQRSFAYNIWEAGEPSARFFGGDVFTEYLERTGGALCDLIANETADVVLIVSHSGFLRAALSWALDAGPRAMAAFEQDSCSVNVLDIDISDDGSIVRKHVRLANFSPTDPAKLDLRLTNGETMVARLFDHVVSTKS